MDFSAKRVIVTGGTRGIGQTTALAFAAAGAKVAVTYSTDGQSAAQTEAQLVEAAPEAIVLQTDSGVKDQVDALVATVIERWGGVDILVNNAGIHRDRMLMFMTEQDWQQVMETNLNGAFLCCQAVLKTMIGNRWGRIINVSSPSGITGRAGQANYAASKGGLIALTKSLAKEVARIGVTVNAICPGVIRTSMTEKLDARVLEDLKGLIPMERLGRTQEVADTILFMASSQASYITGQVISVDGGLI